MQTRPQRTISGPTRRAIRAALPREPWLSTTAPNGPGPAGLRSTPVRSYVTPCSVALKVHVAPAADSGSPHTWNVPMVSARGAVSGAATTPRHAVERRSASSIREDTQSVRSGSSVFPRGRDSDDCELSFSSCGFSCARAGALGSAVSLLLGAVLVRVESSPRGALSLRSDMRLSGWRAAPCRSCGESFKVRTVSHPVHLHHPVLLMPHVVVAPDRGGVVA